jgi:hypothetical protein
MQKTSLKIAIKMKTYLLLFIILLLSGKLLAQNCNMSYEQRQAVNEANASITTANRNPNYGTYINLIEKCSKAIELLPNCSEIGNIYEELIETCITLTYNRDIYELYFYEQAISTFKKYLPLLLDFTILKESHKRALVDLEKIYEKRKDEINFERVKESPTKENCITYIEVCPNGRYLDKVEFILWKWYLLPESVEELIVFKATQFSETDVDNLGAYLEFHPEGMYKNEATAMLCLIYEHLAEYYEKRNDIRNAKPYYAKILSLNCKLGNEEKIQSRLNAINAEIASIDRKIRKQGKRKTWNNGFYERIYYYSYIFQASSVSNSKSMHGILGSVLKNKGVGYYYSFRANPHFYTQKTNLSNSKNNANDNTPINGKSDISSAVLSAGVTYKLFRPFFLIAGLGVGMNTSSQKYEISNAENADKHSIWLYNKSDRSFFLAPEIGIQIAYSHFTIHGSMNYLIALNNAQNFTYKHKLSYSLGVGFAVSWKFAPHRRKIYLAYCFDFPTQSYLSFKRNSSLFGISVGSLKNAYGTIRLNSLYFSKKYEGEEKGNLFLTVGYGNRLIPRDRLYFYVGVGVAHQKGVEYNKWKFNPELGLNFEIGRILLRGGVNIPNFEFKQDNIHYSMGIGYVF